ncbi:hypothetical protein B484DRAFT_333882 [Ochromonadaceae sp. CCMP2298]|nr:hypothetical protein B484DRAFT_333882 [Ochromonadaceae sp. CCMP2298]
MIATEARTSGQFAVFDPRQMSSGVALTCGNHCAIKVGKGQCCCCRAMTPVRSNHFVYFEFSITVSSAQTPTLGIGLSPPDCPLNVMVGSWPRSVGLYTDGLMLTGSRWFRSQSARQIEAGSTVGMLVYIPSEGEGARRAGAEVGYAVNGVPFPHDPEAIEAMGEVVRLSTPLYPTVSLFSEDTRVWCRFCEADVVYRSRGAIGAPKGVRVYCLDGSLLLEETD